MEPAQLLESPAPGSLPAKSPAINELSGFDDDWGTPAAPVTAPVTAANADVAAESTASRFSIPQQLIERGRFDDALQVLGEMPADEQDPEWQAFRKNVEKQQKVAPVLQQAETLLEQCHFDGVVKLIDTVPGVDWTPGLVKCLQTANTRQKRYRELQEEITAVLSMEIGDISLDDLRNVSRQIEEFRGLSRNPAMADGWDKWVRDTQTGIQLRISLTAEAESFLAEKNHAAAAEALARIPEAAKGDATRALQTRIAATLQRIEELIAKLLARLQGNGPGNAAELLLELDGLINAPLDRIRNQLKTGEINTLVVDLTTHSRNNRKTLDQLNSVLKTMSLDQLVALLEEQPQILMHYPPEGGQLQPPLAELLNLLPARPEHLAKHLDLLNSGVAQLGADSSRLQPWNQLQEALRAFVRLQHQAKTWGDRLIEGRLSEQLEEAARFYAEIVVNVLPAETNCWNWSLKAALSQAEVPEDPPIVLAAAAIDEPPPVAAKPIKPQAFNPSGRLSRAVCGKIKQYFRTKKWPKGALTTFTQEGLMLLGWELLASVLIVMSLVVAVTLLTKVDPFTMCLIMAGQVALWAGLGFGLHKLL